MSGSTELLGIGGWGGAEKAALLRGDLFHLSAPILAPGSLICPGNWGRIVRAVGWQHQSAVREVALETCRRARFPDLPSRMSCVFAFPTREEAAQFGRENPTFAVHCLYRVRLVDPAAPAHVANWRLSAPQGAFDDWPESYWRRESASGAVERIEGSEAVRLNLCREVLTLSQLRVEERLDAL